MQINKEQVMQFLPHRDPFLFIDSIENIKKNEIELNPGDITTCQDTIGVETKAKFFVREDLEIFKGHFPGNPILPGVVQIEMMAQAACFAIAVRDQNPFEITLDVAFLSVNNAKFRKPVVPGLNLKIFTICTKCRGKFKEPMMTYDCSVIHENLVMSESSIFASVKY